MSLLIIRLGKPGMTT